MPAANPMNAYPPATSHRVMPALWRLDDKHHAANAMTAALTSAIKLISGSSKDVLARSEKHVGGTTRADMRTTHVARRHSVRAAGTTVEVAFCRVDMVSPRARVAEQSGSKDSVKGRGRRDVQPGQTNLIIVLLQVFCVRTPERRDRSRCHRF